MLELTYSIMPGVAAMANIHPMLVHFPIAFLNGFLLMEVIGFISKRDEFRAAARWMLYLGTLGALVAVVAGLRAEATLSHNEAIHEVLTKHEGLGITVLVLSIILSVWRTFRERRFKAPERVLFMIVAAVMLGVMAFGADMGGLMVYKHGAGVKAVPMAEEHDHAGGGDHHGAALEATPGKPQITTESTKTSAEGGSGVDGDSNSHHHQEGAATTDQNVDGAHEHGLHEH